MVVGVEQHVGVECGSCIHTFKRGIGYGCKCMCIPSNHAPCTHAHQTPSVVIHPFRRQPFTCTNSTSFQQAAPPPPPPAPLLPTCPKSTSMWELISNLPSAYVWSQLIALTGTGYEKVLQGAGVNLTIFVPPNNELTQQLIRLYPNGRVLRVLVVGQRVCVGGVVDGGYTCLCW